MAQDVGLLDLQELIRSQKKPNGRLNDSVGVLEYSSAKCRLEDKKEGGGG